MWCCWTVLGSWLRCIAWRTGHLWVDRWCLRAGIIFWSRRRLGRYRCLGRRWRILRTWRQDSWRMERRFRWRIQKMPEARGLNCCARRSDGRRWKLRRCEWWKRIAARRDGRWMRLRDNLGRGTSGEIAGGSAGAAVSGFGLLRMDSGVATVAVSQRAAKTAAADGESDQRREFDGGRDGQDADGVVVGGEICCAREAGGDS